MKVYGIKTCDKVRAAMRDLAAAGRAPALVDIRATPLEEAEIQRFFEAFGAALVNRRSTTWRRLSEAERRGDPVRLISAHPTLMTRPLVADGGEMTLGWSRETRDRWVGKGAAEA